jgi:hypothetical protein
MSENQSSNGQQGMEQYFFRASAEDFKKIPGGPIAYWVSDAVRGSFLQQKPLSAHFFSDGLTKTGNNEKFLRFHWEVGRGDSDDPDKYRVCVKGGDARDYAGNTDVIVNWTPTARSHYRNDLVARITPEYLWRTLGISWTKISSKGPTFRWFGNGMIAETGGPAIFSKNSNDENILWQALGFLSSKVSWNILTTLNPTLNFQTNDVLALPFKLIGTTQAANRTKDLCNLSQNDWDAYESSRDFTTLPILDVRSANGEVGSEKISTSHFPLATRLSEAYAKLRQHWRAMTLEMQRLEEENNRIFIDAYGLQDELTPDVPLNEITLTCNPHYRYGGDRTEDQLEALLLADTVREFLSYAVGCMFGRYSLDTPGLVLADQVGTLEDYLRKVPDPSFMPDANNVIPILDGDWFTDDIAERFKAFLRLTFGPERFDENLRFIEEALGKKGKPQAVRDYFLKDFWPDHLKRYKKRPIYWLFSSPKGSFNALIYLHRYRPDTVSVVLNDYLREFRTKLAARKAHLDTLGINPNATQAEKTRALKDIEGIRKTLDELDAYERDTLYPLAMRQLDIDLDDGVKVNYLKFGGALKKIPGLEAAEE